MGLAEVPGPAISGSQRIDTANVWMSDQDEAARQGSRWASNYIVLSFGHSSKHNVKFQGA